MTRSPNAKKEKTNRPKAVAERKKRDESTIDDSASMRGAPSCSPGSLFQFLVVVRQVVRHGHETKVRCEPTDIRFGILSRVSATCHRWSPRFGRPRGRGAERARARSRSRPLRPHLSLPPRAVCKVSGRVCGVVSVVGMMVDADHASRPCKSDVSRPVLRLVRRQRSIIVSVRGRVRAHRLRVSPCPANAQRRRLLIVPRVHAVR